jgi:hypothetical protein
MANEKEVVQVLDMLTLGSIESLSRASGPILQVRGVLESPNVVGVGVAEKWTGGRKTKDLSLCFYVKKKLPRSRILATNAVPRVVAAGPTTVLTDVVELGPLRLENEATKTLRPGVSVAHRKASAGTLGAIVERDGQYEILSNSHVLALSGKARRGDPILSPAPADGGKYPRDVVAKLSRFVKFEIGGAFVNQVDCATATVVRGVALDPTIAKLGLPRGVADPRRGMKIAKSGRTTGKTVGTVRDVHFRFVFMYEGVGSVGFLNQILCSRYSAGGDSGSLVLDQKTKRAVGLHFAGAPKGSVFCPIRPVLDMLGVTLVTKKIREER